MPGIPVTHRNNILARIFFLPLCSSAIFFLFFFLITYTCEAGNIPSPPLPSLSIIAPPELLANSITGKTIQDTLHLLRRGFPRSRITLNNPTASVCLILPALTEPPLPDASSPSKRPCPLLPYPNHYYRWISEKHGKRIELRLETPSLQGASCALYGLLQEKLGFRFYHPRGTLIPNHASWPLPPRFTWKATPRFAKKGFHLHTQHPIELTEQLLNPHYPEAFTQVREYVDWLARNQQNVLQFCLVRNIDGGQWIHYARQIVEYAHKRGILVGVQFSLSMLQQQAFQAIHLLRFFPFYRKQIDRNMAWLSLVSWDFVTIDSTMGEHLPDLADLLPATTAYLARQLTDKHNIKVFHSTHVIRRTQFETDPSWPADEGILIHTVMCFSITAHDAPVYGNRNQRFMLHRAKREKNRRETWYWPESSYWVTFDSPVPLFLLPYLQARWEDMNTMHELGISGHLTFSSGWEWGYWLIDWSVARWSWQFADKNEDGKEGPLSTLYDLFPDPRMRVLWRKALHLQNLYLLQRRLLPYLAALPPFAEFPHPMQRPFQPLPDLMPSRLYEDKDGDLTSALTSTLRDLREYADGMESVAMELERETAKRYRQPADAEIRRLAEELNSCLRISALRARHRTFTLKAISALRRDGGQQRKAEEMLFRAASVRREALALVRLQEKRYRYPVELLARRRKSCTAYGFGYLYPVKNLYFWEREEEQIRQRRFDAFFMNIWDFRRILGLESLLF